MINWNKPFNLVMDIKNEYIKKFKTLDTINFEDWLVRLDLKKYNDIFDCLQFNQEGEFLLIRYGIADMQRGMWEDEDSIYRECRSLVIDLHREEIAIAPFRKFFNLNEVKENYLEVVENRIRQAKSVEICDKLDGSMQSVRWYNGEVFMCGSMSLSKENSWRLQDGYSMLSENHINMIKNNPNLTFIFEYISLKDAHVVSYDKKDEGLYLIGIRDVTNGYEFSYAEIENYSKQYNVSMPKLENDKTLDDLVYLSKVYKSENKEGWVINIDGHKIKIKCDDYVKIHRILDRVSSVNVVIEAVADDKYDDLISKVPITHKTRIDNIAKQLFEYRSKANREVDELFNQAQENTNNTKDFMIYVSNSPYSRHIKSYVRNKYNNKDYNVLKTGLRYKKSNEIGLQLGEEDYE